MAVEDNNIFEDVNLINRETNNQIQIQKNKSSFKAFSIILGILILVAGCLFGFKIWKEKAKVAQLNATKNYLTWSKQSQKDVESMANNIPWKIKNLSVSNAELNGNVPESIKDFVFSGAKNLLLEQLKADGYKPGFRVSFTLSNSFDETLLLVQNNFGKGRHIPGTQLWSSLPTSKTASLTQNNPVAVFEVRDTLFRSQIYIVGQTAKSYVIVQINSFPN